MSRTTYFFAGTVFALATLGVAGATWWSFQRWSLVTRGLAIASIPASGFAAALCLRRALRTAYINTQEKLFVLDKNVLRPPNMQAAKSRVNKAAAGALVIDTTILEEARTGKFVDQFEKDFRDWTDNPARMSVSWGVGELLREERQSGKRAVSVVDTDMTMTHRSLLDDLAQKNLTRLNMAGLRAAAEATREQLPGGRLDPTSRLSLSKRMLGVWLKFGNPAVKQALFAEINDPAEPPLLLLGQLVLGTPMARLLEDALVGAGFSEKHARSLLRRPSFTGMLHYAMEAYTLVLWAQNQTLAGGVNAAKHLNQLFDLDYVAYGLCCKGLITNEKLMRRLEEGLRKACEERWP